MIVRETYKLKSAGKFWTQYSECIYTFEIAYKNSSNICTGWLTYFVNVANVALTCLATTGPNTASVVTSRLSTTPCEDCQLIGKIIFFNFLRLLKAMRPSLTQKILRHLPGPADSVSFKTARAVLSQC